jgi:hypothetical protein
MVGAKLELRSFRIGATILHLRKLRNDIRIMRNSAQILDNLFSGIRQGVLAATLTRPEKWWYLSELADFLHTRPSSLQRDRHPW